MLRLDGWSVYRMCDVTAALRQLRQRRFDLVCCEYHPAEELDDAALATLHEAAGALPFVVAAAGDAGAACARELRATLLRQPCSLPDLEAALEAALDATLRAA